MRALLCCSLLVGVGCADDPVGAIDAGTTDDAAAADAALIDADPVDADPTPMVRLADTVVAAPGASGSGFGDPTRAVNGVRGGGASAGGMDIYSLGYTVDGNASITLAWSGAHLGNGDGDDLAVFENPFATAGGAFMDLIIVEVSRDGATWRPLAHDYVNPVETVYVADPAAWPGFAGRTPVRLHAETNPVDPFDRLAAGGDGFDLDDVVGDDAEAVALRADGARYVRLVTAPSRSNPDTGAAYVREAVSNGGDVDGVYGRYVIASDP